MKSSIKFLVLDVDGTLTDGKIYMGNEGELFKAFDIKDGCGIKDILPDYGIIPVIITARKSDILEKRCKELGITELYQGCREKLAKLMEVIEKYSGDERLSLKNVAYIGDDILDLKVMEPVHEAGGLVACPADAIKGIKEIADYVCLNRAGQGAVREFIDWYVAKENEAGLDVVREVSKEAYDYIVSFNPGVVKDGRYELENGVIANVMSYITKPFGTSMYETHTRYIDVQYIIYGHEVMLTEDVSAMEKAVVKPYDADKDITFYDYNGGAVSVLNPGDVAVLYPEDAHRGAIAVDAPKKIRKIVVKVPVK